MLMSFPQPIFGQDTFFTLVQLFFTNAAHMPSIVMLLYRRCAGWVVIAFIQTQVLRLRLGHFGSIYNDGFNRFVQQFRIMDIGPCDDNRQRTTQPIGQNALFRAVFASIRWIGANFIPSQTSLAHRSIGGLPFPIYQPQCFTFFHQQRPNLGKQIDVHPMLERSMDRRIIAIHARNMIPLTACANPKNQGVQLITLHI